MNSLKNIFSKQLNFFTLQLTSTIYHHNIIPFSPKFKDVYLD